MSSPPLNGHSAVVVDGLVKRFGEIEAVKGVEFEVASGEVFGFLGPNGAGKTTTINMLCTLVKPTAGSASVAGHDVVSERDDVRRNIGLVFQDPTLDNYLTGAQNLSSTPSSMASSPTWSSRGCVRSWRWSGCGTAGLAVGTFSAACAVDLRSLAG